jgi:hypothetical protein
MLHSSTSSSEGVENHKIILLIQNVIWFGNIVKTFETITKNLVSLIQKYLFIPE